MCLELTTARKSLLRVGSAHGVSTGSLYLCGPVGTAHPRPGARQATPHDVRLVPRSFPELPVRAPRRCAADAQDGSKSSPHAGAGVMGDHVPVVADVFQYLFVGTCEPGSHRAPVAEPAAERVRSHRQVPRQVLERAAQRDRMIEPPPTAKRRCDLGSRHRPGIGWANAACTSGHADAFHECLVEELAGVRRRPEPDLAPHPLVRRPDNTSLLWKRHGGPVDRIAELITDISYHLGRADEPVRFTENLGRPLGNLSDIRRRPVQSTPGRPGLLLAPRRCVGPP